MHVNIRIGAVGDPPLFPEIKDPEPAILTGVGFIQSGMTSGKTSAAFLFKTADQKDYIVELSGAMVRAIGSAANGAIERFGDPDE